MGSVEGKKIKGFPKYTVTSNGKVFREGKEIKSYKNRAGSSGYNQVKLYKNGKRYTKQVSRLVAGEPAGMDVDHIDNNKSNNDASNLNPMTHRDNVRKAYENKHS